MSVRSILRILGTVFLYFSATMLVPLGISLYTKDQSHNAFITAFLYIFFTGLLFWLPNRSLKINLRFRDGFLVVVLIWVTLCLMAGIPLLPMYGSTNGLIDTLFEATSGLTTTGATVIDNLNSTTTSILFYRQQLQWLGGMGIVVLAVAIIPALGIGGMELYKAEAQGPVKNAKVTPRISDTAKRIWLVYISLTICCAISYWFAGMNLFDAVTHAFSTVSMGGFSPYDESLQRFNDNPSVYIVATIFMLLSGLNFSLHFLALRFRTISVYLQDSETKTYLSMVTLTVTLIVIILALDHAYSSNVEMAIHAATQVISILTTTGFIFTDFSWWPAFAPILLLLLSTAGGCAGSTTGGMKMIRVMLLFKQGAREISKLVHPRAMIPIKFNGTSVSNPILNAVWGFLALYIFSFTLLLVLLLALGGLDMLSAFTALLACLNNLGPGLGTVAQNYKEVSDTGKMILTFAMLLGRLELFTILVLFTPVFWKS